MSIGPVDLEVLIKNWVNDFPLDKEIDKILSTDISWEFLEVKQGPTIYFDQATTQKPQTHVLLTSHFQNDTDEAQTFHLKSERRTQSVCSISLDKTYTIGFNAGITLTPPTPLVAANAGFHGDRSVANANAETFVEEIVWSVNNEIEVPAQARIKAELVLKEEEYKSRFKSETKFVGMIEVKVRNKKKSSEETLLKVPVKQIFKSDHGFRVDKSGIYFVSRGSINCKFGMEQFIRLTQLPQTGKDCLNLHHIRKEA